jgi:hypothetical protein
MGLILVKANYQRMSFYKMKKNLEGTFKFSKNLFTPTLFSVKPYSLTYFKREFKFRKITSKLQE